MLPEAGLGFRLTYSSKVLVGSVQCICKVLVGSVQCILCKVLVGSVQCICKVLVGSVYA